MNQKETAENQIKNIDKKLLENLAPRKRKKWEETKKALLKLIKKKELKKLN